MTWQFTSVCARDDISIYVISHYCNNNQKDRICAQFILFKTKRTPLNEADPWLCLSVLIDEVNWDYRSGLWIVDDIFLIFNPLRNEISLPIVQYSLWIFVFFLIVNWFVLLSVNQQKEKEYPIVQIQDILFLLRWTKERITKISKFVHDKYWTSEKF